MASSTTPLSEARLRKKTDHQLVLLARKEISRSLDCARRRALAEATARYASARILVALAKPARKEYVKLEARLQAARDSLASAGLTSAASATA